ncbi:MAG: ABC transporter permease [Ignavibacteriaceae bacterium]
MLKNYLKVAIRNIYKNKVYSFINIAGLAAGMAACIFIFLYVQNDLSFDKSNKNYDRIYRVGQEVNQNGKDVIWSLTPTGYANAFVNNFSGVKSVRLTHPVLYTPVIRYGNRIFTTKDFIFADSSFFNIFTFPLLEGDPQTALAEPFSLVLVQSEAKKIFGDVNPMGKIIRVSNLFDFKITGVAKDPPQNSSIQFNYLASFVNLKDVYTTQYHIKMQNILNNFSSSSFYTFLLFPKGFKATSVEANLPAFLDKYGGEGSSKKVKLILQPLGDIHFNTNYLWDFPNKGDIKFDYILSAIAFFILLIACVNFINISTARSAMRAREIGLRKVLGANRFKLVRQFTLEFVLLTIVSIALAIVLAELFLPAFNTVSGRQLSFSFLGDPKIILSFLVIWMLVVFLACAYPSIYLSSFQPTSIIRGIFRPGNNKSSLRKFLIVFQFAISVFLIVVTIVILKQYYFLKSQKLGFDKQQVMLIPSNLEMNKNYDAFKTQLLQRPNVLYISRANWVPGKPVDIESYSWMGKSGSFYSLIVDPDYVKALGFKFVTGRNFSWKMPSDWSGSYILNETAAKMMGWNPDKAIGQSLASYHHKGQIIGVVKDFNFKSLRQEIEPVVMLMDSSAPLIQTIVKISSQNIPGTLNYIQAAWKQFSPDFPFNYHFLDQSFDQLYQSEQRLSKIFEAFSALAILIACLGLFGLASYTTQERTKEIGIRKVLGASVPQVVNLVASDFIRLVLIANVIAWPLSYYVMNKWLQNFAYRTDIGLWIFIASGLLTLFIAALTVSFQAIKAANSNPVRSLRYE